MTAPAHRPTVLMILDGWGLSDNEVGNAPFLAATSNFDRIWTDCPHATLSASGEDVGLPAGQMGNSEVGHTNIGAGRVVWMDLPRIDRAIEDGSFATNPALERFAASLRTSGGAAHIMGLISPGGVHSHQRHMAEAARLLAARGVPVKLHLFLDGRDVPPKSALDQIAGFGHATRCSTGASGPTRRRSGTCSRPTRTSASSST
jgi:2,3-bisphosphoglycerate-independent phosphoglycerate mutase